MSARELYKEIAENCCIEFGDYPLNNIYKFEFNFNITRLLSNLKNVDLVSKCFSETIQEQKSILNLDFNKVVSLNYKSAPFMTNIAMETNCGVIYHNSDPIHQTEVLDGIYEIGDECILICDVVSTGLEINRCIQTLEKRGLIVSLVLSLVDYQLGAWNDINKEIPIVSIFEIVKMSEHFMNQKYLSTFDYSKIINCVDCSEKVYKHIKRNLKLDEEERDQELFERTREMLLTERENQFLENNDKYKKDLEVYETNNKKIIEREEELCSLEKELETRNEKVKSDELELYNNTELKIKQLTNQTTENKMIFAANMVCIIGLMVCSYFKNSVTFNNNTDIYNNTCY